MTTKLCPCLIAPEGTSYYFGNTYYCTLQCAVNDGVTDGNLVIQEATVGDLNNIPNGITKLTVFNLENNIYDNGTESYTQTDDGWVVKCSQVNNLPVSLEEITIIHSECKEEDFRLPYGCKLYIRNEYANPPYNNTYDAMAHFMKWRRDTFIAFKKISIRESMKPVSDDNRCEK